jgi:hypothetical protein
VSVRSPSSPFPLWRLSCADAHRNYRYFDADTSRRLFTTSWFTSIAARSTPSIHRHMAMVLSLRLPRRAHPDHATAVPILDCHKPPRCTPCSPASSSARCCFENSPMCCRAFASMIPCSMDTTRLPRSPGTHFISCLIYSLCFIFFSSSLIYLLVLLFGSLSLLF